MSVLSNRSTDPPRERGAHAAAILDLRRVGVHSERGEESVAHLCRLSAGHDLSHLRQIGRIRAAVS